MLIELCGWAGALTILGCYWWITYHSASLRYHIVNLASCFLLMVNVVAHHATPSIFINVVWAGLAINGMWKEHCITRLARQIRLEDLALAAATARYQTMI